MSNLTEHKCAGKCPEFKEGGQCFHCLINETVNRGVYAIGRINLRQDDTPMATRTVEFKKGDYVVFHNAYRTSAVLKIAVIADNKGYAVLEIKNKRYIADLSEIRPATNVEIKAEHRIDLIVEPNDMVDANAGVTVITPKGTSKVKGGMAAFVDMGDAHIENHISPLCKQNLFGDANDMVDSERLQQWKNNIPKFAGFRASNLSKNESQDYLAIKQDALSRMESCYIEQKKHVERLQTEVIRLNSVVERLKVENVVLQAKVDELQAENKMLHKAAATHLRNQKHYMDLYHRLVEQLYPYAIDLEDPVDGDVNIPKEYVDGYNRARECVHYNLLEMMESDIEYIRAQCDMLGGGGEA